MIVTVEFGFFRLLLMFTYFKTILITIGFNFDLFWSEDVFPTLIRFVKNASHDILLIVALPSLV